MSLNRADSLTLTRVLAGLALMAAPAGCGGPAPAAPEVLAFRALLREAGVAHGDTVCVSVAVDGGETDPAAAVVAALRDSVPALRPLSACRPATPTTYEPGLVRLVVVRLARGDTLAIEGETVAEHLSRYVCYVDRRSGAPLGGCRLVGHQ